MNWISQIFGYGYEIIFNDEDNLLIREKMRAKAERELFFRNIKESQQILDFWLGSRPNISASYTVTVARQRQGRILRERASSQRAEGA